MAENEKNQPLNPDFVIKEYKPTDRKMIKIDSDRADLQHIKKWERIKVQLQPGQYFRTAANAVFEIVGLEKDKIILKALKVQSGHRVFPADAFAKLVVHNYFEQIANPNFVIEWELNARLELNRFMRG
jgi:hypothetical protein